jgi:hypothetical protein
MTEENNEHLHPCFLEGKEHFKAGLTLQQNPYTYGTKPYFAWAQGWEEEMAKPQTGKLGK